MGQSCTLHMIRELDNKIKQSEYDSAFEAIKRRSSEFEEKIIPMPVGEIRRFLAKCQINDSDEIMVGFLFEMDASLQPVGGEMHIALSGRESFEDFPFSSENYVSEESAFLAATRYLEELTGSSESILSSFQNSGFFVNNDYVDAHDQRRIVLVRKPYPRNTLINRIGGNSSPNIPPSFCIVMSEPMSDGTRIEKTSECQFDWNSYVKQVNDFLTGDQ